jgi:hypothetical protein
MPGLGPRPPTVLGAVLRVGMVVVPHASGPRPVVASGWVMATSAFTKGPPLSSGTSPSRQAPAHPGVWGAERPGRSPREASAWSPKEVRERDRTRVSGKLLDSCRELLASIGRDPGMPPAAGCSGRRPGRAMRPSSPALRPLPHSLRPFPSRLRGLKDLRPRLTEQPRAARRCERGQGRSGLPSGQGDALVQVNVLDRVHFLPKMEAVPPASGRASL